MATQIETVYIAGLLTPRGHWSVNPAIDYLANVRNMIRMGKKVFFAGFVPFIPALDFQMFLALDEKEYITEPMIKRFSKIWLSRCDAVFLTEGWRKSPGTLLEIEFAKERGIPIFRSVAELKEAAKKE